MSVNQFSLENKRGERERFYIFMNFFLREEVGKKKRIPYVYAIGNNPEKKKKN